MSTRLAVLATVLTALAVKLSVWIIYGPVTFNDSGLYETYARMLLLDDWSWQYRFFDDPIPVTGLRMIGYPAIIALAQTMAADAWKHVVVGLQISFSLAAVWMVTNWASRICGSPLSAILVGLSIALGQSALYDAALVPDSLFSSLAIMILCSLSAETGTERTGGTVAVALLCGLATAAMTLLRGNGLHIAILFLPLAVVWLMSARRNRAFATLALILPVIITVQAYVFWNQSRTGERFLSTSAQVVAFQPLYEMAQHGTNIFDDDSVLSQTVRETTSTFGYSDIRTLNHRLVQEHGWTPLEIADAGTSAFFKAAFTEPLALLTNAGRAFGFSVIRSLFNPALAVTDTHHLITQERLFPGASKILKSISSQGAGTILYAVIYSFGAIFSTVLFLSFLVATPYKCLTGTGSAQRLAILALWAGTLGLLTYYSAIHLEIRYIQPAVPIIVALGLWGLPRHRFPRMRSRPRVSDEHTPY